MGKRPGRSAALAWTIAGLVVTAGCAGGTGPAPSRADVVTVTVDLSGRTIGVLPDRYIGLSFESSSTQSPGDFKDDGNLPRLLENLGPGVLRFGGNSVDQSSAGPNQAALAALAKLVRQAGWNVIFSVSLGRFTAARAGRDAAEASRAFGAHLTAIACGNEPDDFSGNGVRPASFTEPDFLTQAQACISAIRAAVPDARIAGPDTSHLGWLTSYARAEKTSISLLTQHYYPLSDCDDAHGTALALLSRATAAAQARRISLAAAAARTAGVPLRVSETNSASCGGIQGVSDTFASALWAIDYLLTGAEHGASGMNFHDSMTSHCNAYSPICRTRTSFYTTRPIYYGLLFASLLGTGRLLPATIHTAAARSAVNLAAHAIRSPGGTIRVMIENLGGRPQNISLRAGTSSGPATILRLTAPSPQATSQVRIQGATLRPTGDLAPGPPDHAACREGNCELNLPAYSAAIVTLP
ncbi:MAG TPA: glycosyl hydrolase family 79 C-terminal domain-containing protein [Streptosporangiaceae bacterium]|nr:glycosyl hydrolase family 79 C-terminal domain-containing protein [Streptosporangiaceae bacterium]